MSDRFVTLSCIDGSEREVAVLDVDEVVALEQRIAAEGTSLLVKHVYENIAAGIINPPSWSLL